MPFYLYVKVPTYECLKYRKCIFKLESRLCVYVVQIEFTSMILY